MSSARGSREQSAHPCDLGALIGVYIRSVLEDLGLLRGAIGRQEIAHHCECAFMVADHIL
jgi:hypothetical protein